LIESESEAGKTSYGTVAKADLNEKL